MVEEPAHSDSGRLRHVGFDVVEGTNLTRDKLTEKSVVSQFEMS